MAAQSVALLTGVGASVGLFLETLMLPAGTLSHFFDKNTLGQAQRHYFLGGWAVGALVMALVASAYLLVRRRVGVPGLSRAADLLSPLLLSFLTPSLFSYQPWHDNPMPYLVELALFTVLLEWTLRRSLSAVPAWFTEVLAERATLPTTWSRRLPTLFVLAGAIFYAVYFSYYTILNHRRLGTSGYDLGININWMYNALHGHPFQSTVLFGMEGGNFIGNHAIFAVFLWLPIYAIKPGAEVLLIWQATSIALASVTLYLFGRTQLPRWSAALVAVLFLLFAPIHGPNFYDYHELLPAIFWHFLLYWAIATRRYKLLFLLVPILYAHREDVAVGLTILGAFLVVSGKRPRLGMILASVSLVWFILIKFIIMPRLWHTWFAAIYKDLQAEGEGGFGSVVETILINPSYFLITLLKEVKLSYFLHLFAPLALLPLRRPALLLLAVPGFFFTLMTTGYGPTISIAFHYTTHWVPYLFAATVLMLRVLGQGEGGPIRRRAALGAMTVAMVSHSYVFGAILQHHTFVGGFSHVDFVITPEEQQRYREVTRMAAMIPVEASAAATENEVPHIAVRMRAYTLKDGLVDADYILINKQKFGLGNSRNNVRQMMTRSSYGLVSKGSDIYLFKRGLSSPDTDAAKTELGLR